MGEAALNLLGRIVKAASSILDDAIKGVMNGLLRSLWQGSLLVKFCMWIGIYLVSGWVFRTLRFNSPAELVQSLMFFVVVVGLVGALKYGPGGKKDA